LGDEADERKTNIELSFGKDNYITLPIGDGVVLPFFTLTVTPGSGRFLASFTVPFIKLPVAPEPYQRFGCNGNSIFIDDKESVARLNFV